METGGIELGKVFPNASSKRNRILSSREDVGRYVQGLGSFDENQWRLQGSHDSDEPRSYKKILSEVSNKAEGLASDKITNQADRGSWWESLREQQPGKDVDKSEDSPVSPSQSPPANDFQRQPTPDRLKRHAVGKNRLPENITLPRRESNHKTKPPVENADESGTDIIGKESDTEDDDDLDSMKPTAREKQLPAKQENASQSPSSAPRSSSPEVPIAKPKGALGRIGGGGKQSSSPSKPSLGHIGAAKKSVEPVKMKSQSPEPARGWGSSTHKSSTPTKETSQERADRKREMLKRQLEEKSRAVIVMPPPAVHLPVGVGIAPPVAQPAAPPAQHDAGVPLNSFYRIFNDLLRAVLIILSPTHRFVDRFNLRGLLTVVITMGMFTAGGVLITSSQPLWIPVVPTIGAVLLSFVSRQHWLHVALPVAMLAYTLLIIDIGLATISKEYRGQTSNAVLLTVTILWILGLPAAWWLVLQTWKFGAALDEDEEF
ncbi:MAG: hypothetical protein Q9183_001749 [Haloplaca sp. 2 TL-2023]